MSNDTYKQMKRILDLAARAGVVLNGAPEQIIAFARAIKAEDAPASAAQGVSGLTKQVAGEAIVARESVVSDTVDAKAVATLQKIDMKAEAGLCQMTHAGTREFLKDIRQICAGAANGDTTHDRRIFPI